MPRSRSRTYPFGQPVEIGGIFPAGNPDDITVRVKNPTGELTVVPYDDLDHDLDTGRWSYLVDTFVEDGAGHWCWRLEGTGGPTAIDEGWFRVDRSAFTWSELIAAAADPSSDLDGGDADDNIDLVLDGGSPSTIFDTDGGTP